MRKVWARHDADVKKAAAVYAEPALENAAEAQDCGAIDLSGPEEVMQ